MVAADKQVDGCHAASLSSSRAVSSDASTISRDEIASRERVFSIWNSMGLTLKEQLLAKAVAELGMKPLGEV